MVQPIPIARPYVAFAALRRICNEAHQMNVFSSITALTDVELQEDSAFWQKHGDFILSNPRG